MPTYAYECAEGHRMEGFWRVAERPERVRCVCGRKASQVITTAPAYHSLATFSRDIDDAEVRATRNPGDGSYACPTLSFEPETGKFTGYITSEKDRERRMAERGLFQKEPSLKAKDVARLKRTRPIHVLT